MVSSVIGHHHQKVKELEPGFFWRVSNGNIKEKGINGANYCLYNSPKKEKYITKEYAIKGVKKHLKEASRDVR